MTWNEWGYPLVVLGVGLLVGLVVMLRTRGAINTPTKTRLRKLLRDRYDELIAELREWESRPNKDSSQWLEQVQPLRAAAANCLRDLEALGVKVDVPDVERKKRSRVVLGWSLGSLLVLGLSVALMMVVVVDEAEDRVRPLDDQITQAQSTLASNPDDVDANNFMIYVALVDLVRSDLEGERLNHSAIEPHFQPRLAKVQEQDANSPGHRLNLFVYYTILAALDDPRQISLAESALSALGQLDLDKSVLSLWRSWFYLVKGERALAQTAFGQVDVNALNELENSVYTRLQSRVAVDVKAKVRILPGDIPLMSANGTLYITVRDSASGEGMPHVVRSVPVGFMSQTIELDELDVMPMRQNEDWPDPYWIHAFYDVDGVVQQGQLQADPYNVVAETSGPIDACDPVELQTLTLSQPTEAALKLIPAHSELVALNAPWLDWEFQGIGHRIDELGRSPMAQLTDAMDRGDLARAAGWVERLQKQSTMENWPPELWLYGALLQHMGGDSWRGRARLSKMFDELVGTQQRAIFWLWSAWMAADAGETEEWTRSMFEAEKLGAATSSPDFYTLVQELEPAGDLRVTVNWAPDQDLSDVSGRVFVVVNSSPGRPDGVPPLGAAVVELTELPKEVDTWMRMGPQQWPNEVWVQAFVANNVEGKSMSMAMSEQVGPIKRTGRAELVLEKTAADSP